MRSSNMSGFLPRSRSLMDTQTTLEGTGDLHEGAYLERSKTVEQNGNGTVLPSPLKIFSAAKQKIRDIFQDLDGQMRESTSFLRRISGAVIPVDLAMVEHVEKQYSKIKGISEIVSRDHMKVVFFGRTSNGKSSVINAMLRDKVLPTGIGHTTNCFIQVEGTDEDEGYAMVEGSDQRYGVTSVTSLSHALSREHLSEQTLVRLMWPKNKCFLLREDVVLVDSPGIDVTPDTDSWIDKYCLDADVFVLVANSESTLMQTEKAFFHKVSQRLSKPNVFILNNRWDASANEPEYMEEVRRQHLDRNLEFLAKELDGITKEEAMERVYFISAKEMLLTHIKFNSVRNASNFAEGYMMRMADFDTFERKFQECLSKSAVRTKFEQHTQQGIHIAQNMRTLLECVFDKANSLRINQEYERLRQEAQFNLKTTHYETLSVEFREKIDSLSRKAGQEIIAGFKEELGRLPTTINSYTRNWPMTSEQMETYKAGLYETFERNLMRTFEARCSVPINNAVDLLEREMLGRFGALLADQNRDLTLAPLHRRLRFQLKVHFGLPEMCAGFKEDLTFQFSLGWQRIARALLSRNEVRRLTSFGLLPTASAPTGPVISEYPKSHDPTKPSTREAAMPLSAPASLPSQSTDRNLDMVEIAAILSKCGVGTGAVVFMVWRSIGWKVIGAAAASYGVLYGAERLAWHFRTRRRVFKNQFVDYVKPQLASLIHPTANSSSHQVQEELNYAYNELLRMVNESTTELSERISSLRKEVKALDEVTLQAKGMKSKSVWLESQLQSFWNSFISPRGPSIESLEDIHLEHPHGEFWR